MGGIGLSVADLQRWSAAAVREVFHVGLDRAQAAADAAVGLAALGVFDGWGGDTAAAAHTAISRTRRDLDEHGTTVMAVAQAAETAADGIEVVQHKLRGLIAEAHRHGLTVDAATSRIEFADRVDNPTDALIYRLDLQSRLDAVLAEADAIDDALANTVNMADGDAPIPTPDGRDGEGGSAGERLQNQVDAFRAMFHRPPSSTADWTTAAELDPHSYDPKNRGVPASIVAGRITPVPGRGVLRANLFIPSKSVKDPKLGWPPFDDNAGDNRGFDPTAGPASSRVALEIDFENGLVVARQNPSVNLSTGQVRAGSPTVRAAQHRDGAVYLDYAAADPFSPGGADLAKHTVCVQGQLAVQPRADGPRVGAFVTAYPALEVYHDRPVSNGLQVPSTTTVARMWPFYTGQFGPEFGLPLKAAIGDPRPLLGFNGFVRAAPPAGPFTVDLRPVSATPPTVPVR